MIPVCSICGEPVCATKNDLAYRHGFNRYKTKRGHKKYSQEDGRSCIGSGQPVDYKRRSK